MPRYLREYSVFGTPEYFAPVRSKESVTLCDRDLSNETTGASYD